MNLEEIKKAIEEVSDGELLHGIADVFAHILGCKPGSDLDRMLHDNADKTADERNRKNQGDKDK